MSEKTASSSANAKQKAFGPIGWAQSIIGLTISIVIFVYIGVILSILAEWIGMAFFYPEEGSGHSREMLRVEYGYLSEDLRSSPYVKDTVVLANKVTTVVKDYSLVYVGLKTYQVKIGKYEEKILSAKQQGRSAYDVAPGLVAFGYEIREYITAGLNIIVVYAIRLTLILLGLPMFALFFLWGLVKGLNNRDLRRWGVDRESAYMYSYSKAAVLPMLALPFILYLAIPFSVHPALILLPCAIAEGYIIMMMATKFKKYL